MEIDCKQTRRRKPGETSARLRVCRNTARKAGDHARDRISRPRAAAAAAAAAAKPRSRTPTLTGEVDADYSWNTVYLESAIV